MARQIPLSAPWRPSGRGHAATPALQRGMALITGLVLLLVLSIVAIAAMQLTTLEYQMSANSANHSRARQVSESARMAVGTLLPEHVYRRGWTGMDLAAGLDIEDKDSDGSDDLLYGDNSECASDCFDQAGLESGTFTLDEDATFVRDMDNADGDNNVTTGTSDPLDLNASVAVYRTTTKLDRGSGTATLAGYSGLGKGAAGGGTVIHFYVRSEGEAARHAKGATSADVRSRVLN
jgi:hypothetical protein